jgi:N-acylneuraminate cytidylyltransferase
MTGRRILGLVSSASDWQNWIDIDSEETLQRADFLIRSGRISVARPACVAPDSRLARDGKARCRRAWPARIKLLVLDFDGVMTDNRVWVSADGREALAVNRSDGLGIALLRERGVEVVVLSSENSEAIKARCEKLGLPCHVGVKDKLSVLVDLLSKRGIRHEEAIYVGNDVNDLACMEAAGFGIAVRDAHPDVLARADYVLDRLGGQGAVREACDLVLKRMEKGPVA